MRSRIALLGALCACVVLVAGALPATANTAGTAPVISQVYGGGGNTDAVYQNDYIEVFNPSSVTVSLSGWSVQYTSATGTGNFGSATNLITPLSGSLAPGQYLLVQEAAGTNPAPALPTPDITDSTPINMSATGGKVALVNTTTPLGCNGSSTPCSPAALATIVDLIGWDGANFFEGAAAAPATTNSTAALRNNAGCTDSDNNGADFTAGTPTPRNTLSPFHFCPTGTTLSINDVSSNEGNAGATSFDFTVSLSSPAGPGGVTFDIGTADNTATVADNDYAAKSLTSQTIPQGSSAYTFSVLVNGDSAPEPDETFFVNVTNVTGATVTDGQGQGTILNDDLPTTPIHDVQGSGAASPIAGSTVQIEGVVVGDFQGTGQFGGAYVQEEDSDADANPATSEGIFIFTSSPVSVGDSVRVRGTVTEFNGLTELSPVTSVSVLSTGNPLPAQTDVSLPTDLEPYEGMRVRLPQSLVISEYFNYDRFGELVLALPLAGESRPFTPTAIEEPGPSALARLAANLERRITLDDGLNTQNPSTLRHPNGDPFSLTNLFRGGDRVQNTVGILTFQFNLYRIQPTGPADYTATNPRPAAPEPVGGTLRVGAMNTLNFFVTGDPPGGPLDNKCGPAQNLECRGWDTDQPDEFTRQRDKLLQALAGLDADVLGLNELENTTGVEPLDSIVSGLPGYEYIHTGTIGTDAIKVGLIYKPAKVTPVGPYKLLTSAVDPRFIDTKSRPALAQTFEENATGARFTVVVNHLKSKGSDCNDVGDPDLGDGQGNCSQTRRAAAQALVDWLATDPTGSGDPDFLIVGDLNSYAQEDSIDAIKAGPDDTAGTADDYTNLVQQYVGTYAYSYVFDGQAGYLDHALSSPTMTSQVTGLTEWHINSDEPDVLDYDTTFKPAAQDALYEVNAFRTSDHDPILLGLALGTTYDDLCRLTRSYVTKTDVEDGLCDKLAAAKAADERGNAKAKAGALKAYVNQVKAQAGKSLTAAQAATLIELAGQL